MIATLKNNPRFIKWALNLWPPFLGAGICIKQISPDFRKTVVEMPLRWYNKNIMSTHFGGSLYAMTDPFFMLMSLAHFGETHYVWDKSAHIEFISPGRKGVHAEFILTDLDIHQMKQHTEQGEKYFHKFHTEVRDLDGLLVARVEKIVYIKKKK